MDFCSKLCLAEGNMTPDMLKNHGFLFGRWFLNSETSAGHLFLRSTGTSGPNWFLGKKWMVSFGSSKNVESRLFSFFWWRKRLLCGIVFVGWGKKRIYHVCIKIYTYIMWRKRNQQWIGDEAGATRLLKDSLKVKICLFWSVNMSCWGTFIDTWLRLSPLPVVVTSIASSLVNSRWLSDTIIPSRILTSLLGRVVQPNSEFIYEFYECGRMASLKVSKERLEWVARFWSADQR